MAVSGEASFARMSEAQRNAIAQALMAQWIAEHGGTPPAAPYQDIADPSDPDTGYATMADLGLSTPVSPSPGMPGLTQAETNAINANALTNPDPSTDALGGNLTSTSPGLAAALAAPVGTPAGYYGGLFANEGAPAAQAAPGPVAQGLTIGGQNIAGHNMASAFNAFEGAPQDVAQGLTLGGLNIAGYNMASAFNAFEGAPQAAPAQVAAPQAAPAQVAAPQAAPAQVAAPQAAPSGYDQGAAIAADIAGLSALSAAVNDAVAGYAADQGISGGFTGGGFSGTGSGPSGDGTSGATAEGGGVGVGGASTGISGGPGGTGEGGANTGEGGGGGGGDGGAGK
jgi:hypothetical protein